MASKAADLVRQLCVSGCPARDSMACLRAAYPRVAELGDHYEGEGCICTCHDDPAMPPPHVLDTWAKDCRDGCGVTCGDRPCAACMAGGVCDRSPCTCDDDPEAFGDPYWYDGEES